MVKNVQLGEMDFFDHLENVSMKFTGSYVEGVHLGEMDVVVHLSEM
jgi:hypothetical protein